MPKLQGLDYNSHCSHFFIKLCFLPTQTVKTVHTVQGTY